MKVEKILFLFLFVCCGFSLHASSDGGGETSPCNQWLRDPDPFGDVRNRLSDLGECAYGLWSIGPDSRVLGGSVSAAVPVVATLPDIGAHEDVARSLQSKLNALSFVASENTNLANADRERLDNKIFALEGRVASLEEQVVCTLVNQKEMNSVLHSLAVANGLRLLPPLKKLPSLKKREPGADRKRKKKSKGATRVEV